MYNCKHIINIPRIYTGAKQHMNMNRIYSKLLIIAYKLFIHNFYDSFAINFSLAKA